PAYIWMTATATKTCFVNLRCARFLGSDPDQVDPFWEQFVHPDDREKAKAEYLASVEARCEYRGQFRVRRFDGAYRWMVAHGLPRQSADGEFTGYTGAFTDVTERRSAEEDLRLANTELASELRERTRSEQEVHALSARLINAQEEERTRLARELHD